MFTSEWYDVGGLLWCQDSASLLLWQSGLGLRLQLWTLDGRVEHKLTADAAPVSCVCLSNCGRMAAIHASDGRVRVLDLLTWQIGEMGVLVHCPIVHQSSCRFRLKESNSHSGQINHCVPITSTLCELQYIESRKRGVRLVKFSCNAHYLATYEPVYPSTLWVWSLTNSPPLHTVIVLNNNTRVHGLLWHSQETTLAASLSDNRVLVWTPRQTVILNESGLSWPFTAQTYFATLSNTSVDEMPTT